MKKVQNELLNMSGNKKRQIASLKHNWLCPSRKFRGCSEITIPPGDYTCLLLHLLVRRGRIVQVGREEEEEGRPHPVPRLGADVAAEGEPRGQLQDRHGRRHLARRHQLRRDALHA